MNFIDKFLEYSKYAESPRSYFEWAAYTTIASVLRDRVFIKFQYYTLYPNLYTILLSAESSNTRKSIPLNMAKGLIKEVDNTNVISGTSTMPGVIKTLGQGYTNKKGRTTKGASGIILATELTSFIKKDFDAIEKLTDLYDGHADWDDITKTAGTYKLERVCISMLAGSNEALVADLYDDRAKDGGLLARSCIIYERSRRLMNSLEYDSKLTVNRSDLVADLRKMALLVGPVERTADAKKEFDSWYNSSLGDSSLSKTGVEGRIHDTVRKLAMIICISEIPDKGEMWIQKEHYERAIELGAFLVRNQRLFSIGAGSSLIAKPGKLVIKLLYNSPDRQLSTKMILQKLFGDIDKETLEKVIETYTEAGYLKATPSDTGAKISCTDILVQKIESNLRN